MPRGVLRSPEVSETHQFLSAFLPPLEVHSLCRPHKVSQTCLENSSSHKWEIRWSPPPQVQNSTSEPADKQAQPVVQWWLTGHTFPYLVTFVPYTKSWKHPWAGEAGGSEELYGADNLATLPPLSQQKPKSAHPRGFLHVFVPPHVDPYLWIIICVYALLGRWKQSWMEHWGTW